MRLQKGKDGSRPLAMVSDDNTKLEAGLILTVKVAVIFAADYMPCNDRGLDVLLSMPADSEVRVEKSLPKRCDSTL